MGIKNIVKKVGDKSANKVAKLATLSSEQVEKIQLQREEYLLEKPDPSDELAIDTTWRMMAASSVEVYNAYLPQIKEILKKAISKDMALEVNTSNLAKYKNGFYMVDKELLILYKELGGKLVTLGSDAHAPQNVGVDFENAVQNIKSAGFNEYCYFKNRNPITVKID